jgi:hypothetical protein
MHVSFWITLPQPLSDTKANSVRRIVANPQRVTSELSTPVASWNAYLNETLTSAQSPRLIDQREERSRIDCEQPRLCPRLFGD